MIDPYTIAFLAVPLVLAPKIEQQIRDQLAAGHGILKVAAIVGAGSARFSHQLHLLASRLWRRLEAAYRSKCSG